MRTVAMICDADVGVRADTRTGLLLTCALCVVVLLPVVVARRMRVFAICELPRYVTLASPFARHVLCITLSVVANPVSRR